MIQHIAKFFLTWYNNIEKIVECEALNMESITSLEKYLEDIKNYKLLSYEKEKELFISYEQQGKSEAIRDQIIQANLRLVVSRAKKYLIDGIDLLDLIQEGNLGLFSAVDRFDYKKGFKFSTYAVFWINNYILKYIYNINPLKIPKNMIRDIKKINEAKNKLMMDLQKESITPKEIGEYLDMDESRVIEILLIAMPESLDKSVDLNDDSSPIYNFVKDSSASFEDYVADRLDEPQKEEYEEYGHLETMQVSDAFKRQTAEIDALIKNSSALELLQGIEEINPVFYYNRMICSLFPEEEFAKKVGRNFDYGVDKKLTEIRNAKIKECIETNIHTNEIELTPNYYCSDILNNLTRIDRKIDRNKVLLIALAFNLQFYQFDELLTHCLGEKTIDFKNPYEVILSYCLCQHVNTCEKYLALKGEYELRKKSYNKKIVEQETLVYQDLFWNIDTDDALIELALSLPEGNSKSANEVFKDNFNTIKTLINVNKNVELIEKIENVYGYDNFKVNFHNMSNKEKFSDLYKKNNVDRDAIVKELAGEDFKKKKGTFKFLKEKMFNSTNMGDILKNVKAPTKEELLIIVFYRYIFTGVRDKVISEMSSKSNLVEKIYNNFEFFAYPELSKAGFDGIHILDAFERFIVFCTVTEDPIQTFKMIMQKVD